MHERAELKIPRRYKTLLIGYQPIHKILSVWGFIVCLVVFAALFNPRLLQLKSLNSLLMLSSFMAVAALGQGFVILVGGIDLSIPMVSAYSGIILTWFSLGKNGPLIWLIPIILVFGGAIGLINGTGAVVLRIHPIVMTIGMSAILEGAIMVLTDGTPRGYAPSAVTWFSTGKVGGIFISVIFIILLTVFMSTVLSFTSFGRKVYAIGNNKKAALLCGIRVKLHEILAYVISGICSSVLGILLSGFVGHSYVKMGDEYLLISIAAVAMGGARMSGGKGHYIGTFGGAIMLSFISVILISFLIPQGVRNIIFGIIILIAIIGIREQKMMG